MSVGRSKRLGWKSYCCLQKVVMLCHTVTEMILGLCAMFCRLKDTATRVGCWKRHASPKLLSLLL